MQVGMALVYVKSKKVDMVKASREGGDKLERVAGIKTHRV